MTRFLEEVDEQPRALKDLISFYEKDGAELLRKWRKLLRINSRLVFSGMGTSEHAPLLVKPALMALGKAVEIHDAGELLHYPPGKTPEGGLHVLISQSGESAETKKLAQKLERVTGTVVLANDEQSTLARLAGLFLPMKAGAESSVTNKTYLNTLALLYLMAGGKLSKLKKLAGYLGSPVNEKQVREAAGFLQPAHSVHFIARGPALAAARQLALTFMEGARCHGTAFSGGAFRHGPFEVAGKGHRAVFLVAEGKTPELCFSMVEEMLAKGSRVLVLTDCARELTHRNLFYLRVKSFGDEALFPLALAVIQGHLLHHVASLRGYEAGVFQTVTKVTAVE